MSTQKYQWGSPPSAKQVDIDPLLNLMSIKHDSKIILPSTTTPVKISVGESDAAPNPALKRDALRKLFPIDNSRGEIVVPRLARRVKLSVGESYSAPNPALWFSKESDTNELLVFGFEPNPYSCKEILSGEDVCKNSPGCWRLPNNVINTSYFLTCAAVGSSQDIPSRIFYVTKDDPGTSSLKRPIHPSLNIKETVHVPEINLRQFFEFVPWSKNPPYSAVEGIDADQRIVYIDMLKIDTQGNDLEVLRGSGHFLSERVVWIQPEVVVANSGADFGSVQYEGQHSSDEIIAYLTQTLGFKHVNGTDDCPDDLFLNVKLQHLRDVARVACLGGR